MPATTQSTTNIQIDTVTVVSSTGNSTDFSLIFTNIVLNESLSSPAMNGFIEVEDDNNLFEALPIVGQEVLIIKLVVFDEPFTLKFFIYKIGNLRKLTNRRKTYTLYFTTYDVLINENRRISKSYKTFTPQAIVEDLLLNEMNVTYRGLRVENAENRLDYIATNKKPFTIIRELTRRTFSVNNRATNYVFFNDRRGYFFVSLSSFANQTPKFTYKFRDYIGTENPDTPSIFSDYFTVYDFQVVNQSDFLANLSNGMIASQLYTIDILQRKVNMFDYDYFDNFENRPRMNSAPIYTPSDQFSAEGSQYFSFTSPTVLDNTYITENQGDIIPDSYAESRALQIYQKQEFANYVMRLRVDGNPLMPVGTIINLEFISQLNEEEANPSNTFSGRNMVVAISHRMDRSRRYQMTIETVKDSLLRELGTEL
jgi:hypothetical protein